MTKDETIQRLRSCLPELKSRFGVVGLSLFGSASRDEMRPGSDVDVYVQFDPPADFDRYFDTKFRLEELLGCPVDLATDDMLKPRLWDYIERDLIHVS
jgi:predicted nucleotidyltransferase